MQVQTSNIIMNDEKVFVLTMTEMTHLLETVTDTSKSAEEIITEARKIIRYMSMLTVARLIFTSTAAV